MHLVRKSRVYKVCNPCVDRNYNASIYHLNLTTIVLHCQQVKAMAFIPYKRQARLES